MAQAPLRTKLNPTESAFSKATQALARLNPDDLTRFVHYLRAHKPLTAEMLERALSTAPKRSE